MLGSIMARTKRRFSKEFKAEAVKLVVEGGRTCSDVARTHELSPSLLAGWVKQARADSGASEGEALSTQERQELTQLRKRLREAEMENSFLKKCSAFFASQQR